MNSLTIFRWWMIIFVIYMAVHLVSGMLYCNNNFCPGDSETDYVFQFEDETTGKQMINNNGVIMTLEEFNQRTNLHNDTN